VESKSGAAYRDVGRFSKFRGFLSTPYVISTLSLSSPSAHWLERDHLLKVVQRLDRIRERKLLPIDALPVTLRLPRKARPVSSRSRLNTPNSSPPSSSAEPNGTFVERERLFQIELEASCPCRIF
jgi:hypothetical protein